MILLAGAALVAQEKPAEFYFGGKRLVVGMPQAQALALLSTCCKLSPESVSDEQRLSALKMGRTVGQMILPKNDTPEFQVLGSVFFLGGKVTSLTRPLGDEAFLPWNEDVLGFARTLQRSLSPDSGDATTNARVSVRHERTSNAESEVISFTFQNGRGVRLTIVKLDKAFAGAPPDSAQQVQLEEFLEQPWP